MLSQVKKEQISLSAETIITYRRTKLVTEQLMPKLYLVGITPRLYLPFQHTRS